MVFCSSRSRGQGLWRNKRSACSNFLKKKTLIAQRILFSPSLPLYKATNACSPAAKISSGKADSVSNIVACSWKCWLVLNFLREVPFPIPYSWEVVSHPRTACRKRMFLHNPGPSCFLTSLISHTLGLLVSASWYEN